MPLPVAPGAPQAQVAPAGSSPTRATDNPGAQVNGTAKVRQAIKLLESALPEIGSDGPLGLEVMRAIKGLASKAPANQTTAGAESSQLQMLAARAKQMAPRLALVRQAQAGQPPATPGV